MLRLQDREVEKFLMSGVMNVALVRPLLPNSLKAVSKQARLNRYIGECCKTLCISEIRDHLVQNVACVELKKGRLTPSSEILLVGVANRT